VVLAVAHRTSDSYKRKANKYKTQPLVLIICEDTKSSKIYLEDASRYFRSYAKVDFIHSGRTDPLGVVEAGLAKSKLFDLVYCVIDRDSHYEPNFRSALELGREKKSKIIVLTSYPCFEFWLLLHFGYTRAGFMPAGGISAADRVFKSLIEQQDMSDYEKGNVSGLFNRLLPRLSDARKNAKKTVAEGILDNEMNPSTELHILIDKLEDLGKLNQA
jgi:hypothetical protein